MKIVAADPIMLSKNSKCKLETLGELEVFNSTPASVNDYIERIKDAEILLVGKMRISQEVLQPASHLKMICVCHTGWEFEIQMDQSGRAFKGKWWKPGSAEEHEWFGRKL